MKRKHLAVMAGLAATAALGWGTWLLTGIQNQPETAATVLAASLSGDINRITYDVNGETIELIAEDGVWSWSEDASFPLSQGYVQTMQSLLEHVTATELVCETCTDFSEYGLELSLIHI